MIDKLIKKAKGIVVYKKSDEFEDKWLKRFKNKYPHATPEQINFFKEKCNTELARLYPMEDYSILKSNIKRSRVIFGLTFFTIMLFTIDRIWFLDIMSTSFFPLTMAAVSWFAAWVTIPVLYNGRLKGGVNSVMHMYISELHKPVTESASKILVTLNEATNSQTQDKQEYTINLSDIEIEEDFLGEFFQKNNKLECCSDVIHSEYCSFTSDSSEKDVSSPDYGTFYKGP